MPSLLFASDHPLATSGYANQTRILVPRLHQSGLCRVAVLATFGQHGYRSEIDGVPIFPGGADPFANDVIARTADQWQADVVITLKDVGVFDPARWTGPVRWAPLTPIDHEPIPPTVLQRLRMAWQPIAYAPNGYRAMRAAGLDPLYAPHAYDPNEYHPGYKARARDMLGLPHDAYIVGTVAVNRGGLPSRKAWPQLIDAVALAARDCPDLRWVCHTDPADDGFEAGLPLRMLAQSAGIDGIMSLPDPAQYRSGFGIDHLRTLYQAMDVLLCVSVGEGFGIPTLEAQACGRPVILGEWAAQEDLRFAGWGISRADATPYLDQQMAHIYLPDPAAIAQRIVEARQATRDPDRAAALERQALDGAAPYAIDRVVDNHWRPTLQAIAQRIARERTQSRGVRQVILPRMLS